MAKGMTFAFNGTEFTVEPVKIDRRKLYGWSEIHAFDDDGNECVLVATDASGTVVIPKGGVGLGMVSGDGKWVARSQIKTVTTDGRDAVMTPSSYGKVNLLAEKVAMEQLLDCSITSFYHLRDADPALIALIGDDIYTFAYCYRDSYETSPAFLLVSEINGQRELFMLVGAENVFEFIGLNEIAVADEGDVEDDDDSDDIDFSML
ncbi:MAG: hypothetical protein LBB49_03510 [Gracilibacteraceae bacterium]|jgi:hypothetical protein|nr:hypothetical protein [Gracilibacteraceae bacterium]